MSIIIALAPFCLTYPNLPRQPAHSPRLATDILKQNCPYLSSPFNYHIISHLLLSLLLCILTFPLPVEHLFVTNLTCLKAWIDVPEIVWTVLKQITHVGIF